MAAPSSILAVIERRHLTASERACLVVALLPFYKQEAKECQKRKPVDSVQEKFPKQKGWSRDHVAKHVLVNPHYVSDAAMVKAEEFLRWN